jgi:segregation and condensation protein B
MSTEPTNATLSARIEALLFTEGGSLPIKKIGQLLQEKPEPVAVALSELSSSLRGRGISLVLSDTEASLVVSKDSRDAVKSAYERELGKEIGDAGLEVLSILLYRGPSTRTQIDYIRGVNTASTIRTLLSRGLVERTANPEDAREYLYRPTTELLAHLGVTGKRELPEYDTIAAELAAFEKTRMDKDLFESHDGNTDRATAE